MCEDILAPYQLTVSDLPAGQTEAIVRTLATLSGRLVNIGWVCLYAYFDDEEHAQAALRALAGRASCQLRHGQFVVTSLCRGGVPHE
jgi:hypothetical protein